MILRETLENFGDLTYKVVKTDCKAKRTLGGSAQSIPNSAWTRVDLATEVYDPGNHFTNYKYTCDVDGWYHIIGKVEFDNLTANSTMYVGIFTNGSVEQANRITPSATLDQMCEVTDILYLEDGEYIELYAWQNTGGNLNIKAGSLYTHLTVHLASV